MNGVLLSINIENPVFETRKEMRAYIKWLRDWVEKYKWNVEIDKLKYIVETYLTDREKEIFYLRISWATYADIWKELRITKERASQSWRRIEGERIPYYLQFIY